MASYSVLSCVLYLSLFPSCQCQAVSAGNVDKESSKSAHHAGDDIAGNRNSSHKEIKKRSANVFLHLRSSITSPSCVEDVKAAEAKCFFPQTHANGNYESLVTCPFMSKMVQALSIYGTTAEGGSIDKDALQKSLKKS